METPCAADAGGMSTNDVYTTTNTLKIQAHNTTSSNNKNDKLYLFGYFQNKATKCFTKTKMNNKKEIIVNR